MTEFTTAIQSNPELAVMIADQGAITFVGSQLNWAGLGPAKFVEVCVSKEGRELIMDIAASHKGQR